MAHKPRLGVVAAIVIIVVLTAFGFMVSIPSPTVQNAPFAFWYGVVISIILIPLLLRLIIIAFDLSRKEILARAAALCAFALVLNLPGFTSMTVYGSFVIGHLCIVAPAVYTVIAKVFFDVAPTVKALREMPASQTA